MREIEFRAWDKDMDYTVRGGKGTYKMSGYIMKLAPYHPFANIRGYVPEHRLILENKIGRYLKPRIELVHHINGNRSDNRLENLKLLNPKDHAKCHIGERNKNGQFVCVSPEFNIKMFRLYDRDRNITQIYTLNELISKTFRRGKFEYRGEWTGLKDRTGKKIFEGDIVKVKSCNHYFNVPVYYYKIGYLPFIDVNEKIAISGINQEECEVIGSIHQNKELGYEY